MMLQSPLRLLPRPSRTGRSGQESRVCMIPHYLIVLTALGATVGIRPAVAQETSRPNFVIIVADDLGFSDIGMFGGEIIHTPNLDRLASEGVRYTSFYVAPTCSPTRSMLLSGTDNHLAGMGNMYEKMAPNQLGKPGYEGVMNDRVHHLPELLKTAGYHTYMAGKWHLGKEPGNIPRARGFERDFSVLPGSASHFNMDPVQDTNDHAQYTEDGEYIEDLPRDHYSTKTITSKAIEYIESNRGDGKPFLAYVAYQAPHDPLQVPDSWLRRYKGKFDEGWDSIRRTRLKNMKRLGLIDEDAKLAPRIWFVPEWDRLTGIAQVMAARKYEIYASMVEYLDMEVGRIVDYLEKTGLRENTYIVFLSDNGAEAQDIEGSFRGRRASAQANHIANKYRTDFASWGRRDAFLTYGPPWAQVSNTPFWLYKVTTAEGGIRSPLIVASPKKKGAGSINRDALLHVKDIAPTLLELAGVQEPPVRDGVYPMQGVSWRQMLEGTVTSPRSEEDWLAWEIMGMRAVRKGPWKITWIHKPLGLERWQLFNIDDDPVEQTDLSERYPEKLRELLAHWDDYVRDNNVIIPNRTSFDGLEDRFPPRPDSLVEWSPRNERNYEPKAEDN